MNIKKVVVGALDTNCYIISKNGKAIIIDPGDEGNKIIESVNNLKVVGIIITHSHFDHIGALDELLRYFKVEKYDIHNLNVGKNKIDEFTFEVIHTKGHLDDAITIYFEEEKVMFVGDFIFKGSIGRTDMEGANPEDMKDSITKILKYSDDITIYPGHYLSTTLKEEKDNLRYYLNII